MWISTSIASVIVILHPRKKIWFLAFLFLILKPSLLLLFFFFASFTELCVQRRLKWIFSIWMFIKCLITGSLLFTTKFPGIPGTHFIDLGRMKGCVDFRATQWFWTTGPLDWESSTLTTRSSVHKFRFSHCFLTQTVYIVQDRPIQYSVKIISINNKKGS